MERRKLRSFLMDKCIWRVALPVLLSLAATFCALTVWTAARSPGAAADLADGVGQGLYAKLSAVEVSQPFAAGGGDTFYFLSDEQGYLYVSVMSDRQYREARGKLDSGTPEVVFFGMTAGTPDDVRRIACDCFDSISYGMYEDYFGPVYLDCRLTPFSAQKAVFSNLMLICVLGAMGAFILWLRRRSAVESCLWRMNGLRLIPAACAELAAAPPERILGSLAVTDHFLCNAGRGLLYARADLRGLELRRGGRSVRLLGVTYNGARRTIARVRARSLPRLEALLAAPAAGPALTVGLFDEPDYWNMPGEGC